MHPPDRSKGARSARCAALALAAALLAPACSIPEAPSPAARRADYERAAQAQASASVDAADLVVSLHACDTATDAALDRAVRLGARVILAVPCCQHELLAQIDSAALEPLLRHGTLRERFAADVTDAARARLLALVGYDVQVVELFALEHSPKNVLIRAAALERPRPARDTAALAERYRAFADGLAIEPALERLLADRLPSAAGSVGA